MTLQEQLDAMIAGLPEMPPDERARADRIVAQFDRVAPFIRKLLVALAPLDLPVALALLQTQLAALDHQAAWTRYPAEIPTAPQMLHVAETLLKLGEGRGDRFIDVDELDVEACAAVARWLQQIELAR